MKFWKVKTVKRWIGACLLLTSFVTIVYFLSSSFPQSTCELQASPKSWSDGIVTRLSPHIPADCDSLWEGRITEIARVKSKLSSWNNSVTEEEFLQQLTDCTYIKSLFSDEFYISSMELDFPVAFLMTVHDYPQQVIRLLRVLYRPHNVYCIHVDAKANRKLIQAFRDLSKCLPNVLMPEKLIEVFYVYGESILEAQLSCLEVLKNAHHVWKWRYVMNLCGTELPLLTNREIVERLRGMEGSMHIIATDFPETRRKERFRYKYEVGKVSKQPFLSKNKFGPPPLGIKLYKSTTYNVMTYAFTNFILTHHKAIKFRQYIKGAGNAEEHFYISLFKLPEAPVAADLSGSTHMKVSASIWEAAPNSSLICHGTFRNEVCIIGIENLSYVRNVVEEKWVFLFNKYFSHMDHIVMNCLEETVVRQNQQEYETDCT